MRPQLSLFTRLKLLLHELKELGRFLGTPKQRRKIVFYVAQAQYIAYFAGLIDQLLEQGAALCYITADFDDPILEQATLAFQPFYLNKLYPLLAPFLDAKVIVYTTPDLNLFHIRRSIFEANHIFVFHSLCSSHMGLNLGALDHFDTIFCNGPYHKREIEKMESLYGLKPKTLLEAGYYRLEKIYKEYQEHVTQKEPTDQEQALVLIAPSWQKDNIIEACGLRLVEILLKHQFKVVLRPHPMTIYKKPQLLTPFLEKFGQTSNFHLDTETVSGKYLYEADVMICDWSGVAMEYALGTERPVLFIDLPPKIHNPEYKRIGYEPLESAIREQVGQVIGLEQLEQAGLIVAEFLQQSEKYRARIIRARQENIYHFGDSPQIGANYILNLSEC